jgi:hypothetical protein
VLAKPLANGDVALTFINCGSGSNGVKSATVDVDEIMKYIGHKMVNASAFENALAYSCYNIWTKETSVNTTGVFSAELPVQENLTVRVTPIVPKPVVTDGASKVYADGGVTVMSADRDVFVETIPGLTYYYAINPDYVDVFYTGETDAPIGSYFDGPTVNGSFVKSIYSQINTPLSPDNKITVPAVAGKPSLLCVIAYQGDMVSEVFTHTFQDKNFLSASYADGVITAKAITEDGKDQKFNIYAAVYDKAGRLASLQKSSLISVTGEVEFDVSAYPAGQYTFKVFCWDEKFAPLANAVYMAG